MTKKWVISLGGSRIAPQAGKIDHKFIEKFEDIIESHLSSKFIVVTGGGSTARKYMSAMQKIKASKKTQSKVGISVTRFHASFLSRIFGRKANNPKEVPKNMKKVKDLLSQNQVVFCGALRFDHKKTSDGTAADLSSYIKAPFINITNIKGLYSSNPKTSKGAKFIKHITWKKFEKMASKIKFKAGQHFVLDQDAAKTILKNKVPTYIIGSLEDLNKILSNKKTFNGTLISG